MLNDIIIKAINYILENLAEDLTVEQIAEHCHFSKYYFNRLFKSVVGESVYAFIKRLRIEKSALQIIVEHNKTITEIGNRFGYSSSNFSTAFKQRYGKSPLEFKRNRQSNAIRHNKNYYVDLSKVSYDYYNEKVKLVNLKDQQVIFQRFIGDYHNLGYYWSRFCEKHQTYIENTSVYYEISYDDPILTDPERCFTDLAISTTKPIAKDCLTTIIEGGKYVSYTYTGPNTNIFETFQGLLGIWLPDSVYLPDLKNRKVVAKYIIADVKNNFFSMDIYIPVV
ncbi:AraC family transcriptional regulator [Clostridium sp. 'deep sea']|uniref:AraC family transcriptional regulator n=1 Tax=Clostridium sp. 'deep sea' TaxID=2779445 RepID=UPI0018968DDC|nr:AraC family transcriptional regulator [Clostridium sp. 'deep sea']QOR35768.1 AraC family transcriptional regulator [Clostridium sp. 'deep sea']